MGTIRALLVGVCEYPATHSPSLPLCKNDVHEMRRALIGGLNVCVENIWSLGETGSVTTQELLSAIAFTLWGATEEDTFIFYFSGHGGNVGGKNCLVFSNDVIELQALIDVMERIPTKNKIAILDSCHSGDFSLSGVPPMNMNETVEHFAGHGFAVMASCGANEFSGFHDERQMSLYTSFVCDALTSRFLIRQGKKSLEAINEAIFRFAEALNSTQQRPVFRSNIGGTVFFEVEDYHPYQVEKIYVETDTYIIYDIEPVHHANAKRYAAKVILRFQSTPEQIAEIAKEVQAQLLNLEIYANEVAQAHFYGKPANIIWCYFGYDEEDMVNSTFLCHTTWVDDTQDKGYWYRNAENIHSDVYIEVNPSYQWIKELTTPSMSKEQLIQITQEYTARIVSAGERYIRLFREYLNHTLTEAQFIDCVAPLNTEISNWYCKQSELPFPPKELHNWRLMHTSIASTIHDFSLYYNKKFLDRWSPKSRQQLLRDSIKRYELELEELKATDGAI